ncbi:MAG: hypothetical protein E3J21_24575 [Anaerolineales bacterium]|nr:MAG: hypothetical protein E3J21_24575 [Anaerolineales bacterium]
MDKGIGFNRNITLSWLDAAAAFCAETEDPAEIRARLEPVVSHDLDGVEAQRKTIDILINIWLKSGDVAPDLRAEAVAWFQATPVTGDRLWLHYGLTLLYYPFFRDCTVAMGQFSRYENTITTKMVKQRLVAERGHLGSLDRAVERVIASLRNWGILTESDQRYAYAPKRQTFSASSADLEAWLLACALHAHPAEELPFADLLHLPELFPFRFALAVDHLRAHPWFVVQRQGAGWDMVRLVSRDTL